MTRRSEELRGLAERVKALAGPDRLYDGRIEFALHGKTGRLYLDINRGGYVARGDCPQFTASLDAAMSLVPERWTLDLQVRSHFSHAFLECQDNGREVSAQNAATPALALCAAALIALAEVQP
jgi:hypothetical protein